MRIVEGLKWYYELCGSRGVCEIALFRFFGRPKTLAVVPPLTNHPVHLRIGTSDFCSYRDVLVFQTKSYDPKTRCFVPKTIVDVGAHIGMASIGEPDYPMAMIFAVEPEPSNFAALLRNVLPYKNIVPIHAALWPVEGRVSMEPSNAHPKGTFRVVQHDQPCIRAITMDTLMRENGIDSIDLLKWTLKVREKTCSKNVSGLGKYEFLRSNSTIAYAKDAEKLSWPQQQALIVTNGARSHSYRPPIWTHLQKRIDRQHFLLLCDPRHYGLVLCARLQKILLSH